MGIENNLRQYFWNSLTFTAKLRRKLEISYGASQVAQWWRIYLLVQEMQVWSLGQEDPLEEEVAAHSNILVWKIPWTEEPGGLKFMGLQRVGHNLRTEHGTRDFLYIRCPYTPHATHPPITFPAWWSTCYNWRTCMDTLASYITITSGFTLGVVFSETLDVLKSHYSILMNDWE